METGWRRSWSAGWLRRIAAAFGGPALVTLLAVFRDHPPTAVVALLYVMTVVIAARVAGAVAGMGASALSFLALNFFFTPPLHTFEVGTPEDIVALSVFLVISVIVGVLFSSTAEAKAKAERREQEARLLNSLATRLLAGHPIEEVLTTFADGMSGVFDLAGCEINTTFTETVRSAEAPGSPPSEEIRLAARARDIGRISLWLGPGRTLSNDERVVIRSLATQFALALEGMRLSFDVKRAEHEARASQLEAALFSGVTHDVKTPLAAITTSVTSLIEGRDFTESDRRDHLETIKQEADRLNRVVNNLLDIARLQAGALVVAKAPGAIDELMEGVLNRLRPLLADRDVEMRVGDDVPEVPMDVVQIDQVLTNLIENAIKFSPPSTPISLSAVGSSDRVRVTVSDRGPGVSKEDRKRIFEPFERAAATESGTGLGLAISKAIIVAHGGQMWVADNPAGGASFTFELPCSSEPSEEVTDAGARAGRG